LILLEEIFNNTEIKELGSNKNEWKETTKN
jgi:hypothetical protein